MTHGNYQDVVSRLQSDLRKADAWRNDLQTAIQVMQKLDAADGDGSSAALGVEAEGSISVDVDLDGAKNLGERLVRIAIAAGQPINALAVAEYLIERGYSKAQSHNLRPHVYNTLNDHPDFEKVGKGTFQYVPNSPADFPEVTLTTGTCADTMLQ